MTAYLDTSVLVPLFLADAHTPRVEAWLASGVATICSVWTVTEVTSAFAHNVRVGRISATQRAKLEADFDIWLSRAPPPLAMADAAFDLARTIMRSDVSLRAPDALHLAMAEMGRFELSTLDAGLSASALRRGLTLSAL